MVDFIFACAGLDFAVYVPARTIGELPERFAAVVPEPDSSVSIDTSYIYLTERYGERTELPMRLTVHRKVNQLSGHECVSGQIYRID